MHDALVCLVVGIPKEREPLLRHFGLINGEPVLSHVLYSPVRISRARAGLSMCQNDVAAADLTYPLFAMDYQAWCASVLGRTCSKVPTSTSGSYDFGFNLPIIISVSMLCTAPSEPKP